MEGGRHTQLGAALPQRVVVVGTVEAQAIDPASGAVTLVSGRLAQHQAAEQEAAQAQLPGGELEFGDGLLRVVGGDHAHGAQAIGIGPVGLGVVAVAGSGERPPQLGIVDRHDREPDRGVEHGHVDADLGESLVQKSRKHGGGAVDGVA